MVSREELGKRQLTAVCHMGIMGQNTVEAGLAHTLKDHDFGNTMTTKNVHTTTPEANQLQYVNKQIRSETRGLGLRYNSLTIMDIDQFHRGQRLGDFIRACPITQYQYLKQITAAIPAGAYSWNSSIGRDVSFILRFCEENPHITLKWETECFRPNQWLIVDIAVYSLLIRKSGKILEQLTSLPESQRHLKSLMPILNLTGQLSELNKDFPANLRIVPPGAKFDEGQFRELVLRDASVRHVYLPHAPGGLDSWVEIAKEVYANGI